MAGVGTGAAFLVLSTTSSLSSSSACRLRCLWCLWFVFGENNPWGLILLLRSTVLVASCCCSCSEGSRVSCWGTEENRIQFEPRIYTVIIQKRKERVRREDIIVIIMDRDLVVKDDDETTTSIVFPNWITSVIVVARILRRRSLLSTKQIPHLIDKRARSIIFVFRLFPFVLSFPLFS